MRLKMFKVTVIMPVYNDEKYLVQAISSVLNQTLTGIELLCINDGSTDNSKNILDSFDEKYDSINVIHQTNSGAAACRNKAMKKASGDYITFLDSDDFYLDTDALEKMYNVAVENDAKMVSANIKTVTAKNKIVRNGNLDEFDTFKVISPEDYGIPYTFGKNLYNKQFLLENNFMFPEYSRGEDPVFLAEVLGHVDRIYCVPVKLMGIRGAKYHGLLKIDTYEKKQGYIEHFHDTFKILEKNNFNDMKERYKEKLFEFIEFARNYADKKLYNIVHEVFKDDEVILDECENYFNFIDPKVSIISLIDDKEYFYTNLIHELLKLNFRDTEFVFIGQSSEGGDYSVLEDFINKDNRARLVFDEDIVDNNILDIVLKYSTGEFIIFLNPGDRLNRNSLNRLYDNAINNDSDLVLFNNNDIQDNYVHKNNFKEKFKEKDLNNFSFDYKTIKSNVFDSSFLLWGKFYNRTFLESLNDSYLCDKNIFNHIVFHIQCLLSAKRISYVKRMLYQQNEMVTFIDYTQTDLSKFFEIMDAVKKYLVDNDYYEEFVDEFNSFKVTELLKFTCSEDNYNIIKDEFKECSIKESNIDSFSFKRYDFILSNGDYEKYLNFDNELNIEELNSINEDVKNQCCDTYEEYTQAKNDLEASKELNKNLFSSNSWKISKPLRNLR